MRNSAEGAIEVEGTWQGGRKGWFREKKGYGGVAVGAAADAEIGRFDGYAPLVAAIVTFLQTRVPPVPEQETVEILAFMEADVLSKERGGAPVEISEAMERARGTRSGVSGRNVDPSESKARATPGNASRR